MKTVSVIVPVRDEAAGILQLVGDLLAQNRPATELLFVDTGSLDGTVERLAACAKQEPRVRLLQLGSGFPGAGRNAGLCAARSEWVAFVDGGMRVDPNWLRALMTPVDRGEEVDVVLGGLEPETQTRADRAAALAYVPARRPTPTGAGQWRGFCLPCSAVRRQSALDAGGFPESLRSGEDRCFFRRLEGSARIAYTPDAVVHWSHAASVGPVWRRFRTYAEQSLRAGLTKDWFAVTARRYAALALTGPGFPLAASALLLARAAVMQRRKPEFVDAALPGRAWQLLEVAMLLGIIDAATWAAWVAWRRDGAPHAELDGALSAQAVARGGVANAGGA